MKRYLPFILIALVAVLAAAGGRVLYRKQLASITPTVTDASGKAAGSPGAAHAHMRGDDDDAKVILEEFGDFQCPPCGVFANTLAAIERDYGDEVCVVFRNFPLAIHLHAVEAAQAAEAAGLQGKFWEMHDLLYQSQLAWSTPPDAQPIFAEYAKTLGLDVERFRQDCATEKVRERIEADQKRGESLGVKSTPTVFLNNHLLPPQSFTEPALRATIDAVIRGEPPPTPAPTPLISPAASAPQS